MSKHAKQLQLLDEINGSFDSLLGNKLTDEQLEEKYLCENSLYYFAAKAWASTKGENSFIPAYHLQAICEHLEALYKLEINRLIINCPFRVGKSTVCSVDFQPWVWANDPSLSFLFTSYKESLSVRDSVFSRRLIKSDWYQSLWGHEYQMMSDVNNKLRFENTHGGYRISSSVSGGNTGDGGHFEICFPYEMLVTTNLGEIPIGRIVEEMIDCTIASFNHETNEIEYQPIDGYMKNPSPDEIIEIELEDGRIIECTGNHPIYTERGYVSAQDLMEDDIVLSLTNP